MLGIFGHPRATPAHRRLERHQFQDHISSPAPLQANGAWRKITDYVLAGNGKFAHRVTAVYL